MCHCFCCCGYVIRKANWHTLSGFFPLFSCGSSLAMVKTDVKSAFWRVSFFRPDLSLFFLFLYLCHLPTTCYSWVLFLKQNVVHRVLSFWHQLLVMPRSYMLMLFQYLWISSQIEPHVTSCYHCMQTLELVQTKNSMSSHSDHAHVISDSFSCRHENLSDIIWTLFGMIRCETIF